MRVQTNTLHSDKEIIPYHNLELAMVLQREHNICCVCGGPGMTQCETGKWLCQKHSPYTTATFEPSFNEYLAQKGMELASLMIGMAENVARMTQDKPVCPFCNVGGKHKPDCPFGNLIELTKIKTDYHPLAFFGSLKEMCPRTYKRYLQAPVIYGHPPVYEPATYIELPEANAYAQWISILVTDVVDIKQLTREILMGFPFRIGYQHQDKYKDLPIQERPSEEHAMCEHCEGHGYWNICAPWAGGKYIVNQCKKCFGVGWIHPTIKPKPDPVPKNWLFVVAENRYTWAYARPSEQYGQKGRVIRCRSKMAPAVFLSKVNEFLGEELTLPQLFAIENGEAPLYDSMYFAVAQVGNMLHQEVK